MLSSLAGFIFLALLYGLFKLLQKGYGMAFPAQATPNLAVNKAHVRQCPVCSQANRITEEQCEWVCANCGRDLPS